MTDFYDFTSVFKNVTYVVEEDEIYVPLQVATTNDSNCAIIYELYYEADPIGSPDTFTLYDNQTTSHDFITSFNTTNSTNGTYVTFYVQAND